MLSVPFIDRQLLIIVARLIEQYSPMEKSFLIQHSKCSCGGLLRQFSRVEAMLVAVAFDSAAVERLL